MLFKKKKINKTVLNLNAVNKKNRIQIFFFDFGEPFIYAKVYKKNILKLEKKLDITKEQIENGKILNVSSIINQLKALTKDKFSIDLVLSSTLSFDSVISLPKIGSRKLQQLKRKDIKTNFDKYKNSYHLLEDAYTYNLGYIYTEHFISNDVINNWIEIAKGSNAKLSSITLFGNYLYNYILSKDLIKNVSSQNITDLSSIKKNKNKKNKKKSNKSKLSDFAFIFVHDTMASFILSSNNQLSTFYNFDFKSKEDIVTKFLLVVGKHEVEFEKKPISHIFISSNIALELDKYLKDVSINNVNLDLFKNGDISLK